VTLNAIWDISDVWVSSASDVDAIATGNGATQILHYNGISWTDATYPVIAYEFFGIPNGPLYAYADEWLLRSTSGWTTLTSPEGTGGPDRIDSLWGTSKSNLYAVTSSALRHYDGSWSSEVAGLDNNDVDFTDSFYGTAADDVWYSDHNQSSEPSRTPRLMHYDGSQWTDVWSNLPAQVHQYPQKGLYGLFGSGRDDLWGMQSPRTVVHYGGSTWTVGGPTTCDLMHGWASSKKNAWLVGKGGCTFHWDGTSWSKVDSGTTLDLYRVRGTDPRTVWIAAASKDTVLRLKPAK
jgi:hypothetical protein